MRSFADDDQALAGAIGLILMLAVAVTIYAHTVRSSLPVFGENAENQWDQRVSIAFQDMGRSVTGGIETGTPVTSTVPAPPPPQAIALPFLGSAAPILPSGTVSFAPVCTTANATHTLGNGQVVGDITSAQGGCVNFRATNVYSPSFGYVYELGGILRLQGGRAVVVAGPALSLVPATPTEYRIALTMPALRGSAVSASADSADVHVDVIPGPAATEVEQEPNAARIVWNLTTPHPDAWKTWFTARFTQAGFVANRASPLPGQSAADFTVACLPANCTLSGGTGNVIVTIEGPRTDTTDMRLSITYGLADVIIR